MRTPNGYGGIVKLSGKRRNPYGVRVTDGWTDDGKQKYKYLGYFRTKKEALLALSDYHKNPYEMTTDTFADIYEKWSVQKFNKISESNIKGYKNSFNHCSPLHDIMFSEIKTIHLQKTIDECGLAYPSRKKIKVLFNQLYKFALSNDIVPKSYSEYVDIGSKEVTEKKIPFTEDEIKLLWDNHQRFEFLEIVLILIYTGMRPGELLVIENKNINLEARTMTGGIKNETSKNRIIPIHDKIFEFIKKRKSSSKYLITNFKNEKMKYSNFLREYWYPSMTQLQLEHKPHECRHTFASRMHSYGADELCTKRILGHAGKDITQKVYTHTNIDDLFKAIHVLP